MAPLGALEVVVGAAVFVFDDFVVVNFVLLDVCVGVVDAPVGVVEPTVVLLSLEPEVVVELSPPGLAKSGGGVAVEGSKSFPIPQAIALPSGCVAFGAGSV